ncbi:MAG: plasmid pRiA4b ORF-3 family protein [Actinomycetota bacterium]|nr:plasmid pRiA4b ORF-3 family protein [Actinomycetota bacterium]
MTTPSYAVDLDVTLQHVEPIIRRRVRVSASDTLFDLYFTLINAMGWNDSHLHAYIVDDVWYSAPFHDIEPLGIDERTITVGEALPKVGFSMTWLYDMGDNWEHNVEVAAIGGREPGIACPVVIDGERACPPDDCGGAGGYMEVLETIANPRHRSAYYDNEGLRAWAKGVGDPDRFDLEATQKRVADPRNRDYWSHLPPITPDLRIVE